MACLLVFVGGLSLVPAQTPDCQLEFSPQLQISASNMKAEQLQSIVYSVDGDFFELQMPFQQVDVHHPLVLTLPSIELDEGIHIVSAYVQTASGEKLDVVSSIKVASEANNDPIESKHLLRANGGMQTCACEQLFDDQQPDVSQWFNLYKNAQGDHDLFISEDHGQSWTRPEINGRLKGGCPTFDFGNSALTLAKQGASEAQGAAPTLDWTAFPSPFKDKLNLKMQVSETESVVISLVDTQGRVLQQVHKQVSGTLMHEFETSNLAQGPYYITILTEKASYSRVVVRI